MKRNECVINYFGSKVTSAHKYPAPRYPLIIEPFAGGAGYSLLHRTHDVVINDLSVDVSLAWDYVVHAPVDEILALPLLAAHQHVDTVAWPCAGARALVRWCLQFAPRPANVITGYAADARRFGGAGVWSAPRRERIARIAAEIRHWYVFNDRYENLPDVEATWFIDPPYQGPAGTNYKHGSKALDYKALGAWCQSRRGQVIVCENEGADWLPWNAVIENRHGITKNSDGTARRKIEVAWIR